MRILNYQILVAYLLGLSALGVGQVHAQDSDPRLLKTSFQTASKSCGEIIVRGTSGKQTHPDAESALQAAMDDLSKNAAAEIVDDLLPSSCLDSCQEASTEVKLDFPDTSSLDPGLACEAKNGGFSCEFSLTGLVSVVCHPR